MSDLSDCKWKKGPTIRSKGLPKKKTLDLSSQQEYPSFFSKMTTQSILISKHQFWLYYNQYDKQSQERRFNGDRDVWKLSISGSHRPCPQQQNKDIKIKIEIPFQKEKGFISSNLETQCLDIKNSLNVSSESLQIQDGVSVQIRQHIGEQNQDLTIQFSQSKINILKEMNKIRQQRISALKNIDVQFCSKVTLLEKSHYNDTLNAKYEQNVKQEILKKYPYLRETRGDGNCLFSSLAFSYLEYIFIQNDFDTILNLLIKYDVFWVSNSVKQILIDKELASQQLFLIFSQLKQLSERENMNLITYSSVIVYYMNNVKGFYDIMVIFMRSLIIESFNKYSGVEPYNNFFDEESTQDFLLHQETFEMEGDFQSICFFSEITDIEVKLVNFSDQDPLYSIQHFVSKTQISKTTESNITLMYNDGHYGILYTNYLDYDQQILDDQLAKINFNDLY